MSENEGDRRYVNFQVEQIDDVRTRVARLEGRTENFATKTDLAELKAQIRGDLVRVVLSVAGLLVVALGAFAAIVQLLS